MKKKKNLPECTYLNFPPELLENALLPKPLGLAMLGERQNFTCLLVFFFFFFLSVPRLDLQPLGAAFDNFWHTTPFTFLWN